MKLLFWSSILFVLYTYAGYPLLLALLSRLKARPVRGMGFAAPVSVVIAARNEESTIAGRIENLLSQEYPAGLAEIVVVSDGSTDETGAVVAGFADRNVVLLPLPEGLGKAVALNRGVGRATGEIIVFTDARQTFSPGAVRRLVQNFADPAVGCVSGELMLTDDGESGIRAEMGAYWRYEKGIRRLESASGSVVGATGAIFAIRRALYRPLPEGTILDDVLTPMTVAMQGYRVLFDGGATACDRISKSAGQEWRRKVRTLAGNWQLLTLAPSLLLPWRSPLWWRFLSHKLCRLLVPFALLAAFVTSLVCEGYIYLALLAGQSFLYAAAAAGALMPSARRLRFVNVPFFFMLLNAAAVAGLWLWLTGRCAASWRPAYRNEDAPQYGET